MKPRPWSENDDDELISLCKNNSVKDICLKIGRTIGDVCERIRYLRKIKKLKP